MNLELREQKCCIWRPVSETRFQVRQVRLKLCYIFFSNKTDVFQPQLDGEMPGTGSRTLGC